MRVNVTGEDDVKEWKPRNRKDHPCFTCNMFPSRQNLGVVLDVKIVVIWEKKEGQWLGGAYGEFSGNRCSVSWSRSWLCSLCENSLSCYFMIYVLSSIFIIIQYRIKNINNKKMNKDYNKLSFIKEAECLQ